MEGYKIVYRGGTGEITEKKSRFIATVQPAASEEEAVAFLASTKKKYWDATHNCSAFVVGSHNEIQRSSDDGEPAGTAGHPMLDVLLGEQIHDAAVVVTRYFGGTLLGTGGLVRAYSRAVQEGLSHCVVLQKRRGILLRMETDYAGLGKIQYLLARRGLAVTDSVYTDRVTVETLVPQEEAAALKEEVTEGTGGRTVFREKAVVYAFAQGTPVFFPD